MGGARAQIPQHRRPTKNGRATAIVDHRRCEHHVARLFDRCGERLVVSRVRWLGELHVVGDRPRALQLIDRLGVQRTGERPLFSELPEGGVVDAYDHHVSGGIEVPPDGEASVDGVELGVLNDVGRVGNEDERRQDARGTAEHEQSQPAARAPRPAAVARGVPHQVKVCPKNPSCARN